MRSSIDGRTFTDRARREQIVAAAIELIAERGYGQASVSKIAERVGVAKSLVLYHFAGKDELVSAVVTAVFVRASEVMVPAMEAEPTAAGKLTTYIRSNCVFIDAHRSDSLALLEILTSFRTESGLRLDQAAAEATAAEPPRGDLAKLDPVSIFTLGLRTGEFRPLSAQLMAHALRSSIDGAVWNLSRDPGFDVLGYGEELVTLFDLATRRSAWPPL